MRYETLVNTETLARHLEHPDWLVFDCRFELADPQAGERAWQAGHVPGAVYAHLERELSGPVRKHTGRHPLPDSRACADWLGRNGVGPGVQVVVYDDCGGAFAARLWWLLRWLGHESVAVLDGGWQAWLAENRPVSTRPPQTRPRTFRPRLREELRIDVDGVLAIAEGRQAGWILDARAPERFRGREEPIDPVAGHIPGALNLPFQGNLDEHLHFLPPERLRARYGKLAGQDGNLVCMCGSGVTACHDVLALEIAGLPGARLYAGSWSEWIRDPARPVEKN